MDMSWVLDPTPPFKSINIELVISTAKHSQIENRSDPGRTQGFTENFNINYQDQNLSMTNPAKSVDQKIDDLFGENENNPRPQNNSRYCGPVDYEYLHQTTKEQMLDSEYKLGVSPDFFQSNNSDPERPYGNNEEFGELTQDTKVVTLGSGSYPVIQGWISHISSYMT